MSSKELFRDALEKDDKYSALQQVVVKLVSNGTSKTDVVEELTKFYERLPNEAEAEIEAALNILDELSGFCSPEARKWVDNL